MIVNRKQNFYITGLEYCTPIYMMENDIKAIQAPAVLSSSKLLIKVSLDGETYSPIIVNSGLNYIPVQAGKITILDGFDFSGIPYVSFAGDMDEGSGNKMFNMITVNR